MDLQNLKEHLDQRIAFRRVVLLMVVFLSWSCGRFDNQPTQSKSPDDVVLLRDAYEFQSQQYTELTKASYGWPSVTDCDATLWAGEACAAGIDVQISLAEYEPGQIHRRPDVACWNESEGDVGSKSTISRDALTGYMACLWERKDLDGFKRLAKYGEDHAWVMGLPVTSGRTWLQPNLTGLLGRALFTLSNGKLNKSYRRLEPYYQPVTEDYEKHIQVLGIHLQGRVSGGISDAMLERLTSLASEDPGNAFFASALAVYTGDTSQAMSLLLSDQTVRPTYVRGDQPDAFAMAHWLLGAKIVLGMVPVVID